MTSQHPSRLRCVCGRSWNSLKGLEHQAVRGHAREFAETFFTVWRCPECRSLHSFEEVDLDYYYARYPLKEHRLDFVIRMAYRNRLAMLRKAGLTRAHRILDYGCGAGLFVRYLREQGYRHATGYDHYVAAYSDSGVLTAGHDYVTSYDVIEHFDDPRQCMRDLHDATRPGGFIVIGTPNGRLTDLEKPAEYMVELSQPYHRHILSDEMVSRIAAESGCEFRTITHRFYLDTLVPFVNTRFAWSYMRKLGNHLDVAADGLRLGNVIGSPKLLFFALFGYFLPVRSNFVAVFQRPARPLLSLER